MTELVWSPTIDFVRKAIADEGQLRLIVAPFIKLDALQGLLNVARDVSNLQVVVRWHGTDLVTGVSDVGIYPFLKEIDVPLFIHDSIHLKLLVYNRSTAFHTSGNVTKRGLGLVPRSNLEIGCAVTLDHCDWRQLFKLLALSLEVDDHIYEQALRYKQENTLSTRDLPPLTLAPSTSKMFSTNSLPASTSPEALYSFYADKIARDEALESSPQFVHDLVVFSIPDGLDRDHFFSLLCDNFKSSPFIRAMVEFIRGEGSVRFGGINAWIAETCSDSPRPYRRDLKTTTRNLYNWLSFFYDEIVWDQPNYSMVIYWKR